MKKIIESKNDLIQRLITENDFLKKNFGINTLAVCGGSGINGSFYNENLYDQLDIIMSPIVGENEGLTLFGGAKEYRLYKFEGARPLDHGVVYLKYSKI